MICAPAGADPPALTDSMMPSRMTMVPRSIGGFATGKIFALVMATMPLVGVLIGVGVCSATADVVRLKPDAIDDVSVRLKPDPTVDWESAAGPPWPALSSRG